MDKIDFSLSRALNVTNIYCLLLLLLFQHVNFDG